MIYLLLFRGCIFVENQVVAGVILNKSKHLIYSNLFLKNKVSRNLSVLISGTGQIGTSWCALSLAHALNMKKKRVLLVDGNGNFSNIGSYLILQNSSFLEDYVKGKKTLNQLIIPYKNKNFHILTAKQGSNFLADLPSGRMQIMAEDLQILAENHDHTVIDFGTELTTKDLSLCQIADNILIMCSENSADLIKTFDLIKFINETRIDANYNLIINKVNSFEDGYKIYEELNKAADRNGLKCPDLLGIIRVDTRIRDTIRNKELLLSRYPTSEAALDICSIAKKLDPGI